jgi:hypothetical protein
MSKRSPSVMISSTFYDLRQIRNDLANFILEELAYTPLLSELSSFPVDPDADTIENCRRRVESDADILILVIGGRYGFVDKKTAKSITNIEYLAARSKGIPVFVFIQKNVLDLLPTWRANPNADFTATVEDNRIFQFIEEIRSSDKVWTFEFELARQIIETLKTQFAYLMTEGLNFRLKFIEVSSLNTQNLSGESLRLILEKPKLWEARLFAQSLVDQIVAFKDLRRDYELGIALGIQEYISVDDFLEWLQTRIAEIIVITSSISKLVNVVLKKAFGPLGTPGDPEQITYATRKIASVYREAIEWSLRISRTRFDELVEPVKTEMTELTTDMIHSVETFGPDTLKQIDDVLSQPATDHPRTFESVLAINVPNIDRFTKLVNECIKKIKETR